MGFLWDTSHVSLNDVQTLGALNPTGSACSHRLRPGVAAHARFETGLDLWLVGLHLDSGITARDYGNRRTTLRRLGEALPALDGASTRARCS